MKDSGELKDGSRAIIFDTPCGYEVALIKTTQGKMKINAHFQGEFVADFLVNHEHLLSAEGAEMLAHYMGEVWKKKE